MSDTGSGPSPKLVGLRGPDEVRLDEAVYLVRPDLEAGLPPSRVDVPVMALRLAHLAELLDELEAAPGNAVFLGQAPRA